MSKIMAALARRVQNAKFRETSLLQLNHILKDEVTFLESQPDKKREIQKEWLLTENLPLFEGITIEFSQIFGNILRNAIEAMRDQPTPRLRIASWYDESNICISITDNGPGISIEQQEKIFDAFFSTKAPMERTAGAMGLGIGLYNCRELLRQYGGQIEVLSKPGLGATFVITLPLSSGTPTLH
jgi:signal transduction histidine kinase